MAKSTTTTVWNFNGTKIRSIEGAKLGASMVTLPNGQRWSRSGHGLNGDYTETEIEAARTLLQKAKKQLRWAKEEVAEAEAALAECKRVLGDDAVEG